MKLASRTPVASGSLVMLLAVASVADPALAHGPDGVGAVRWLPASPAELLVVVSLASTACVYAFGLARLWRTSGIGHGVSRTAVACFVVGWLSLVLALASPLHPLGQVLFAAHMGQHEILMLVAAPLLVAARPGAAFLWALPRAVGRAWQRVARTPIWRRAWRTLTVPLVAWSLHAIALWIWHVPALFEATLRSELVHAAQHASFLLSALLFWWALVHAPRGRAAYGVAILALFSTSLHSGLLGALLTFATTPWYPSYARTAPGWGLAALEDQQLGGLLMWIPAGVLYMVAALVLFACWLREAERGGRRSPARPMVVACALGTTLALAGCRQVERQASAGGDPEHGRILLRAYGCATCHAIPGVVGARGLVGPSLDGFATRIYVGGTLPNTPANVAQWVQNPRGIAGRTAMPDVGVTPEDARDIAAYLDTLR